MCDDVSAAISHAIFLDTEESKLKRTSIIRGVPSSAVTRKSVVMGTVWVFRPTETHSFDKLCVSRMVERFGKDDGNWEHIYLHLSQANLHNDKLTHDLTWAENKESMEAHPEDHASHSDSGEYLLKKKKKGLTLIIPYA